MSMEEQIEKDEIEDENIIEVGIEAEEEEVRSVETAVEKESGVEKTTKEEKIKKQGKEVLEKKTYYAKMQGDNK